MNEIIEASRGAALPPPRIPITVRPATMEDLSFIDGLQKKHTKQVGFMPTKQFEGKIAAGHVLVAEEGSGFGGQGSGNANAQTNSAPSAFPPSSLNPEPRTLNPVPVGYLIGNDQYFKHDDIGIIYQINIAESHRRSLVAATLLKAQFERSAYGCRLYCCWCAQDIEANYFWESMGFVPLAFRAGSREKSRVHIFWQKRIRAGDETTPYWFPSQTTSGSIREDRLVFPIPPGTHWSDAKPIILPGAANEAPKQLPAPRERKSKTPVFPRYSIIGGGLRFATPEPVVEKPKREKRKATKNDPKLVAAARELRDRWLERVNADPTVLLSQGKYEVCKALTAPGRKSRPLAALTYAPAA